MLDWLFPTKSADGKSGAELDAQIRAQNDRALALGTWSPAQYEQANANLSGPSDKEQLNSAFVEGWEEGAENVKNTIGGGVNAIAKTATGIIPWQVWVIAAAGFGLWLFFQLGGLSLLKGKK